MLLASDHIGFSLEDPSDERKDRESDSPCCERAGRQARPPIECAKVIARIEPWKGIYRQPDQPLIRIAEPANGGCSRKHIIERVRSTIDDQRRQGDQQHCPV